MSDHSQDRQLALIALDVVRRRVREAVLESVHADDSAGECLEALEEAVMRALDDPAIAPALACVAGTALAHRHYRVVLTGLGPAGDRPLSAAQHRATHGHGTGLH